MMFKDRICPLLMLNDERENDPFRASDPLQRDFWDDPGLGCLTGNNTQYGC